MAKQVILTNDGLEKLKNELEHLRTVTRNEIAEKIKIARGFGDLSENSEYDEAKNEQAKVEARIIELETILKNVKIIDGNDIDNSKVMLGATVKVLDIEFDEELIYKVVGSAEADPQNGQISDESPVGKALLGHAIGETVAAEAPGGEVKFKILDITR